MSGRALIVAASVARRRDWGALLAAVGLSPVCAESAALAGAMVDEESLLITVTEWNDVADQTGAITADLLRRLARRRPAVIVIVCDSATGDSRVAARIAAAHPSALLHPPTAGPAALAARLSALLGRSVGDLRVERGLVIHSGTGAAFRHPFAVQLMLAAPHCTGWDGWDSIAVAVSRFRRWLREQDSCVRVVTDRGAGQYHLVVDTSEPVTRSLAA